MISVVVDILFAYSSKVALASCTGSGSKLTTSIQGKDEKPYKLCRHYQISSNFMGFFTPFYNLLSTLTKVSKHYFTAASYY
jgi:hypothetical protein